MRVFHIALAFACSMSTFACGDDDDGAPDAADVGDAANDLVADATPDSEGPDSDPPDTAAEDTAVADSEPADTGDGDALEPDAADVVVDLTRHMLCHEPGGAAASIIIVPEAEVAGHLGHGDVRGPCSPLAATLVPEAHTVIACDGREITPADATVDTFVFLHDVEGVRIEECVVRFDFPVFIVGGGDHVIADNALHAATYAVSLFSTRGNVIEDNLVRYGGRGIVLDRDTDRTLVQRNDTAPVEVEPGAERPGLSVPFDGGGGPGIAVFDHPDGAFIYAIINGELVQIPNRNTLCDDNVFRDNDIVGGSPAGIAVMVRANRTQVQGNRITGGESGIASFGFDDGGPVDLPGRCSLAPDRACGHDDDCEIAGIDAAPLGACEGASSAMGGEMRVVASLIEGNVVDGAEEAGILQALTRDAVVRDNSFTGSGAGIVLVDYSIEAITVTGNVVTGNGVGLAIERGVGLFYGADVSGNDFVDNALRVRTDIVARVDGNFWGHEACPGFLAEDAEGPAADCAPYPASIAHGVGEGIVACGVDTRPSALDGVCAFDAPASVSASSGSEVAFEVSVHYSGSYAVDGYGLAAATTISDVALPDEFAMHRIDVPAGTRHLRLLLDGVEAGKFHDLDLYVFDGSCPETAEDCPLLGQGASGGSLEQVDFRAPALTSVRVYVGSWYVDGEQADYRLSWWAVLDEPGDLTVSAPSEVVSGTTVNVEVAWPGTLAAGRYLGVLEHANGFGPLRTTLLEVDVPASR